MSKTDEIGPINRLTEDLGVNCDSYRHFVWKFFISLPNLIFVGVIFPVSCFIILYQYKQKKKVKKLDYSTTE